VIFRFDASVDPSEPSGARERVRAVAWQTHCFGPNAHVRFSNRPSGVKHFQTVHHCKLPRAVLVACALQVIRMVLMSLITTRPGDGLNMSAPV
jgi:hypothetical protein